MNIPDNRKQILTFINHLRGAIPNCDEVFTSDASFDLYLMLRDFYPQANILYSAFANHVITEINGFYYSIEGMVEPPTHYSDLIKLYGRDKAERVIKTLLVAGYKNNYVTNKYLPKQLNINFKI